MNDMSSSSDSLKFPVGHHICPDSFSAKDRENWMKTIHELPTKLIKITKDLTNQQLAYTYRPEGWSVQKVVHHLADSHMNSFIRFKLSLTEDTPTIKPYNEAMWAEMDDYDQVPIEFSLSILHGVHARWSSLLGSMKDEQFQRSFHHPESGNNMSLNEATSMYAWHCEHHFAHIENALSRKTTD